MKKTIRIFTTLLIIAMLIFTVNTNFASEAHFPTGGTPNSTITNASKTIWGSVVKIVQILSFAAILFAGLRYMFAAADARAEIKKSLGVLALGAFIVFGASSIVSFVTSNANSMLN